MNKFNTETGIKDGKLVDTYVPHPKQVLFHKTCANEVLFGGAAGPGKSRALRAEGLRWACTIPGLQIYLFRRTFPELEKNHIISSQGEFPKDLGEYKSQARRWEFFNGSMLHFCHCQYEQDVFQYQGAEIHLLLIDELTTFTKFQYDYLRGRVRCTLTVPEEFKHKVPGIYCASNPGGVGHTFCRARWVDYARPMEVKRAPVLEGGMLRQYIPALLEDNPTLTSADPGYRSRLEALPEPYRTAYLNGDWDIFIGQAFDFYYDYHVIKDHLVPSGAPVYMTFDWGFGAPFSVCWFYIDQDGRMIMFSEWYGWDGNQNKGLRLADIEVADGINTREQAMGVLNVVQRIAGPDCFQKKPDYRGGGQGPSTAEIFSNRNIFLTAGDANRKLKIRQFRNRLMVPKNEKGEVCGRPMLQVFESCTQFIRTIPAISAMPSNPEDIDTTGEDHCLHGDTKVYTDKGLLPIRELVGTNGKVLTPDGYVKYDRCWMTRKKADIVEISLSNGRSIKCTPDHKILNKQGCWIEAKDLTNEECHIIIKENVEGLLCELTSYLKQRKNLMRSLIGNAVFTTKDMVNDYIGQSGNGIMGLFQKVATFIIGTATDLITKLKTLTYLLEVAIYHSTPPRLITETGLRRPMKEPNGGMEVKLVNNGIKNTLKNIAGMHLPSEYQSYANSVIKSLWLSHTKNTVPDIAPIDGDGSKELDVKKEFAENVEKSFPLQKDLDRNFVQGSVHRLLFGNGVKVNWVKPADKADVFCFSIPYPHAFVIEGGLVSHNCYDSVCLLAMARPVNFDDTKLVLKPLSTVIIDALEKKQPDEEFGDYVASETDAFEKAMGYGQRGMGLIYDRVP